MAVWNVTVVWPETAVDIHTRRGKQGDPMCSELQLRVPNLDRRDLTCHLGGWLTSGRGVDLIRVLVDLFNFCRRY